MIEGEPWVVCARCSEPRMALDWLQQPTGGLAGENRSLRGSVRTLRELLAHTQRLLKAKDLAAPAPWQPLVDAGDPFVAAQVQLDRAQELVRPIEAIIAAEARLAHLLRANPAVGEWWWRR